MDEAAIVVLGENNKEESRIPFHFNPSDYSIKHSPKYEQKKGMGKEKNVPGFLNSGSMSLSVKMTLNGLDTPDETLARDIFGDIKKLRALALINSSLHTPPKCRFEWGSTKFDGCVTSLNIHFTMFTSSGKPVRATVDMTLTETVRNETPLESPDRTKRRVLRENTPLYLIAQDVYGDCGLWRPIAAANGIVNPRRAQPGAVLKIPPLET